MYQKFNVEILKKHWVIVVLLSHGKPNLKDGFLDKYYETMRDVDSITCHKHLFS